MTTPSLIILFVILELMNGLFTFNFFKAAGHRSWEAFIPIYNKLILLRIIERPWWWVLLIYLPVVGNVMAVVLIFELLHVFNYRKLKYTIFTIITAGLYLAYLNFSAKLHYVGRDIKDIRKHVSELAASLIFAIVAATVIRAFTFEAFTIPTPSMEKSLMVGDFLFVSKLEYGSRPPMTPLAFPLVHNKLPFFGGDSYSELIQLPYWRFPKLSEVQKGDPVVFNYPAEDIRPINMEGKVRPIDKREHYVKRCVATPGDTLRIDDRQVMINGEPLQLPANADRQFSYFVQTDGLDFNPDLLKEKFDINYIRNSGFGEGGVSRLRTPEGPTNNYIITIPDSKLAAFKEQSNIKSIEPIIGKPLSEYSKDIPADLLNIYRQNGYFGVNADIFPNPKNSNKLIFPWSRDNYGPLWLPKAGATIELNEQNYYKYQRVIAFYEGNDSFEKRGDKYFLNGEPVSQYTFKQGYYFMMGDNRHSSDDSRYWGFVPEDHIVGKPVFIWMSYDKYAEGLNKIRFDRVFTTVSSDENGERRSYFWPFVVVVVLFTVGNRYYKKHKADKKEKEKIS